MKTLKIQMLLLLTGVFLVACSSPGTLGLTSGAAPSSGSSTGDSDPGTANAAPPPTSIIVISNVVDTSRVLAYNSDDSNYVPVVGDAGTVSSSDTTTDISTLQIATKADAFDSTVVSLSLARSAQADDLDPLIDIDGSTESICDDEGVSCWPVNADGSFEAYAELSTQSTASIYYTLVDAAGVIVNNVDSTGLETAFETVEEHVNNSLIWVAQNPQDIQLATDGFFGVLGQDMLTQIKYNSELSAGRFQVVGDYLTSYKSADAVGAASIAFDEASNLTLRQPEAGIDIFSSLATTDLLSFTDSGRDVTVANTEEYTQLKFANDGMKFVRKPLEVRAESEYIYNALDGSTEVAFLEMSDGLYHDGTSDFVKVSSALIFDVDSAGYALVVFEDDRGGMRVRMGTSDASVLEDDRRFGGETSLTASDYNFLDIQIFHQNSSGSDLGEALLLDSLNNKLWMVSFNHYADAADDVRSVTLEDDAIDLGSSKNPQSFVFNSDKSRVFVVNQGDDTISVITLVDAEGNVRTVTDMESDIVTINLSDYLNGKAFTVTANKAAYYSTIDGDYLLVGSEGISGAIVVDLDAVTLPDLQAVVEEEAPAPPLTPASLPAPPHPRPTARAGPPVTF